MKIKLYWAASNQFKSKHVQNMRNTPLFESESKAIEHMRNIRMVASMKPIKVYILEEEVNGKTERFLLDQLSPLRSEITINNAAAR